jgi:hypothetical protein
MNLDNNINLVDLTDSINSIELTNSNKNIERISNKLKKKAIKKGSDILKNNKFFNDLDNIMDKKNNFRLFYNEYFKDFTDIKTIILYMKLYETIENEYLERNGTNIEKELLAYMIKELMNDSVSRKNIFESFYKFTDNNNPNNKKYVLDLFDNNNNKNNVYDKKYIKDF